MGNDQPEPIGEFERDPYFFTVRRDGEVHCVQARNGKGPAVLVCHIYSQFTPPDWCAGWFLDSWRPWIEQHARRVIADAENDRGPVTTPTNHIK
jgi:hypothetical protein